LVKSEHYR